MSPLNKFNSFIQSSIPEKVSQSVEKLSKGIKKVLDKGIKLSGSISSPEGKEQARLIYHDLRPKIFDTNYIPDTSFKLTQVRHWIGHQIDKHKYDRHTLDGSSTKSQINHLNAAIDTWKAENPPSSKMNELQSTLTAGRDFEQKITDIRNPTNFAMKGQLQQKLGAELRKNIDSLPPGKQLLLPCSLLFNSRSSYSHAFVVTIQRTNSGSLKLEIINTQKDYVQKNHVNLDENDRTKLTLSGDRLPSLVYETSKIDDKLIEHLIKEQTGEPDNKKTCTNCPDMQLFYTGIKTNMAKNGSIPKNGPHYKEQGPVGICAAKCLSVWAHNYLRGDTKEIIRDVEHYDSKDVYHSTTRESVKKELGSHNRAGEVAYKQLRVIQLNTSKKSLENMETRQSIEKAPIRFKYTSSISESDLSKEKSGDKNKITASATESEVIKIKPSMYNNRKEDASLLKTSYKVEFISRQLDLKIEKTTEKIESLQPGKCFNKAS